MRLSTSVRPFGGTAQLALFLCLLLAGLALSARAQDNVSIPKSRLEELEKKEAELEKLRNQGSTKKPAPGNQSPAATSNTLVPVPIAAETAAAPPQVIPTPTLSTLPALKKDEVVSAIDLANHFQLDSVAAQQRYHKQSFAVQGEIERFEKSAFSRSYSLIMKTGGSNLKVICEVYPPEPYTAVFTASQGSQIVGVFGENRKTLASADSIAVIRGECKGLKGSTIVLKGCALKSVRPVGK